MVWEEGGYYLQNAVGVIKASINPRPRPQRTWIHNQDYEVGKEPIAPRPDTITKP